MPAQCSRDRPNVRPGADAQIEPHAVARIRDDVERVDARAPDRHLHRDAAPRKLVRALAADLYRRSRGNRQLDLTPEVRETPLELGLARRHEPPTQEELEQRLADLRGEVELSIPAASAVKIGGERAYKLARRGVAVEMPIRRSRVDALDVITYTGDSVRLDLRVSSGTYVRSIATALGGHCRTLRRLEIGPFDVADADPDRFIPPDDALAALEPA